MDDSTQDRAAHTPGPYNSCSVRSGMASVDIEWIDEHGRHCKREVLLGDVCRMADSHADLLAALEGTIDSLVYIEENIPKLIGSGVRHRALSAARAALAKATGQRAIPAPMTRPDDPRRRVRRNHEERLTRCTPPTQRQSPT